MNVIVTFYKINGEAVYRAFVAPTVDMFLRGDSAIIRATMVACDIAATDYYYAEVTRDVE